MSEEEKDWDFGDWTNGKDYLFPANWIGEWNSTISIKEDKNGD